MVLIPYLLTSSQQYFVTTLLCHIVFMRNVFCFNSFNQSAIILRYSAHIKPCKMIKTIKTGNIVHCNFHAICNGLAKNQPQASDYQLRRGQSQPPQFWGITNTMDRLGCPPNTMSPLPRPTPTPNVNSIR